jgi:hypothetical protein
MRWPRFVPAGTEPKQAPNTCVFGSAAAGRPVASCNRISDRTSPRKDVQSNFSRQLRVVPEYPGFRDTLSGIREANLDEWAAFVVGVPERSTGPKSAFPRHSRKTDEKTTHRGVCHLPPRRRVLETSPSRGRRGAPSRRGFSIQRRWDQLRMMCTPGWATTSHNSFAHLFSHVSMLGPLLTREGHLLEKGQRSQRR